MYGRIAIALKAIAITNKKDFVSKSFFKGYLLRIWSWSEWWEDGCAGQTHSGRRRQTGTRKQDKSRVYSR
jgi:hypothetical protein